MDKVQESPLSEGNIHSIIIQVISVLNCLSDSVWPFMGTNRCVMLFTCWPCSVYFSPDLHHVKLAFWWYDLIAEEVHAPDPRKYLFVAPEIILEDRPDGNNQSHMWCLGVVLYAM